MRILTSLALVVLILTLPWTVLAAPSLQATVDIKSVALTRGDLPRGFDVIPERTVSEERPDGVAVYDVTFARERTPDNLAAGPFEIRSGVARTAQVDEARAQLSSTKDAFVAEGWTEIPVPALGDDKVGLTQMTDGEGGKLTHFAYMFRKGALILMVGVRGRPEATKMEDAVSLAIVVSGRVDKALGAPAPAPAAGNQASRPPSVGHVRVANVEGGSANVRSEPSTSAEIIGGVAEGTVLDVIGPDREADGRTWRNVRLTDGPTGWIAAALVENVAAPAPAAAPSPAPSPAAAPLPPTDTPPTEQAAPPPPPPAPAASPEPAPTTTEAAPSGSAPAGASGTTARGTGNGIVVESIVRDAVLTDGTQLVKVRVTRDGGGVEGAWVDVTARLDPRRFRAIRADRTNRDGWTEVEWPMEGPPGTYEVIVEARLEETGPATVARSSFRWR